MTHPTLGVQLYSVRDHLADLDGTLSRLASFGITSVEPFNVLDDTLRSALERHGLTAPSGQFPFLSDDIEVGGQRFDLPPASVVFEAAAELGIQILIDPMVAPERWRSRSTVSQTAERLNQAADDAASLGLRVGYHNHSFEFHERFGGVSAYEAFAQQLDERVVLELDVYWAAISEPDVVDLVHRLGPRIGALHIKDGPISTDPFASSTGYDAEALDQCAAGDGDVPLAEILDAATWSQLDIIEFDHAHGDVFDAIAASARYVRQQRSS